MTIFPGKHFTAKIIIIQRPKDVLAVELYQQILRCWTSSKPSSEISPPYKIVLVSIVAISYKSDRHGTTLPINWGHVCVHLVIESPIFTLFILLFIFHQPLRELSGLLDGKRSHVVIN